MTATSPSSPDPLAALPLLAEAGVSVYWQSLDGRTAWVADAGTREVWISRAIPRSAVLRSLIEALEFIDDGAPAEPVGPRLVHSADVVEAPSWAPAPTLGVVRDG
ncbi:hypothetical protein LQ327_01700 [Actinomycetospora endophytica]|uniref:Uncharacterized protein n=1 Tax=Actinomycetospora endophytica TaxID=2291215 RepID=A0ABS8P1H6_9PSEU|nr:hypothetical protein [Actinomycetospora endophytica]MCD2192106.1 hypothetical protein [Actinomycetospora endophytica]